MKMFTVQGRFLLSIPQFLPTAVLESKEEQKTHSADSMWSALNLSAPQVSIRDPKHINVVSVILSLHDFMLCGCICQAYAQSPLRENMKYSAVKKSYNTVCFCSQLQDTFC